MGGGWVSASDCVDEAMSPDDGSALTGPSAAVVYSGIFSLKASRKTGVPNVSVSAIPRTYNGS